jgi:hypothetical protein
MWIVRSLIPVWIVRCIGGGGGGVGRWLTRLFVHFCNFEEEEEEPYFF